MGAAEEDLDLSALSATLETKLGFLILRSPPPYRVSRCGSADKGREELQRQLHLFHGHLSLLHPRLRTVPECNVGDTSEAKIKR